MKFIREEDLERAQTLVIRARDILQDWNYVHLAGMLNEALGLLAQHTDKVNDIYDYDED